MSNSLEVFDLDTGDLLGKVVDLHVEGLMLLSDRPLEMFRAYALQVNLPMNLNGLTEFILDAETMWRRESIAGGQFWTGLGLRSLGALDEARRKWESWWAENQDRYPVAR